MPVLNITILEGRSEDEKQALVSALTKAVQDSLGSPASDVRIFVNEIAPGNFASGGVLRSRAAKRRPQAVAGEG
jgi:4-oxalocrotonate tautomerase